MARPKPADHGNADRTYRLDRDTVVDHRTGVTAPAGQTLRGDLDAFIRGHLARRAERRNE